MTRTVLLGDITDINSDSVGNKYPFDEILYLDTSSVTENNFFGLQPFSLKDAPSRAKRIVRDGDIVYSTVRPNLKHFGYIQSPAENTVASTGFAVIRAREGTDSKYLYYWLASDERTEYLTAIADSQTSTFPAFNPSLLGKLKIDLPGLETQKKIADILGTIDEKIELNRRMNETLEQMGQALFRHYFISNPETEKWDNGKFSDVADVLTGKGSVKTQLSENGTVPLYGANGIMGTSEHHLYDESLVITGRVGTLGKVRAVTGKAWFSDNVLIIKPKVASFGFIYSLAQTFDYISMNRGSTQPLVTQTDLKNRKIRIPDNQTLERFEQQFSNLFEQQQNNEQQIQTLTTLRDTLLPRLISGKVKV